MLNNFLDKPLPAELLKLIDHPSQCKKPHIEPNMSDLLARQNRKVMPTLGDGNCFFRTITQLIYNTQEQHTTVRNEIISYIENNLTRFRQLLLSRDITIEQHTAWMKNIGEWATQVELQAATEVDYTHIYLFTLTPSRDFYSWYCYEPKTQSEQLQRHIEIAHPSGVHFEVVLDGNTDEASQTPPALTRQSTIYPGVL